MSDFRSSKVALSAPDPLKRVNYTFGLVLGADEFVQEQTYFLEKNRLLSRSLHGYGTVTGLQVRRGADADVNLEIQVTAGLAISVAGHEICVPRLMCARINEWLARYRTELEVIYGAVPAQPLSLAVVLCYRECETDTVPVPGEPCRSQADAMAASRIRDAFEILLCLNERNPADGPSSPPTSPPSSPPNSGTSTLCRYRPSHREEEAVRALGQLLDRIVVSDTGPFSTLDEVMDAVRHLAAMFGPPGSPPASPPSSPPLGDIVLPEDEACDILRALIRVWITEVRPTLVEGSSSCCVPREKCVLLAELAVPVSNWQVAGTIDIDERNRPLLLSTRTLQEWVQCGPRRAGAAAAPSSPPASPPSSPPPSGPIAAGGDLTGFYPDPTIANLQGRTLGVFTGNPRAAQALAWNAASTQWVPRDFVVAPATTNQFGIAIVAAARFAIDPETQAARPDRLNYGRVEANRPPASPPQPRGTYIVTWAGYANPDDANARFTFVVKGTNISLGRGLGVFEVLRFDDAGVLIRVGDGEGVSNGFMIEVTAIGVPA